MRLKNRPLRRHAGGFSLVELMVAMIAGLIIIVAAILYAVSSMRAYSENMLSAKLTQELRTSMNLVVRELRRAGHDSTAVSRVLTTSSASGFDNLEVVEDDVGCVVYEYDRQAGDDGPDDTEIRGFRLTDDGVLQLSASGDAVDCDGTGEWQDITDPSVVTITKFRPELVESTFCAQVAEHDTDGDDIIDAYDMARGAVRTVSLCLAGQMVAGDGTTRHVTDSVRIRAEELNFEFLVADNTCEPAAEEPAAPIDLNADCAE